VRLREGLYKRGMQDRMNAELRTAQLRTRAAANGIENLRAFRQ